MKGFLQSGGSMAATATALCKFPSSAGPMAATATAVWYLLSAANTHVIIMPFVLPYGPAMIDGVAQDCYHQVHEDP